MPMDINPHKNDQFFWLQVKCTVVNEKSFVMHKNDKQRIFV